MNRRTFEGPMDWEYQDQGPIDLSSPFAKISQGRMPPFDSPSKYPTQTPNPFAAASSTSSPSKPQPQPPHTSVFNPQIQNKFSAPPFRNPAFTTPQKRVDELVSEYSGAESSPAMTDTSEIPPDTPDADRRDELARMTITPATVNRTLFSGKSPARSYVPGRGEVPRGRSDALLRDKVRKRRRQPGDRDVGSVRHRLPHGSDDSDSDWEEGGNGGPRNASARSDKDRKSGGPGWFSSFLTAINNHPSAPAILSRWVQLAVNIFLVGGFLWFIYGAIAMMRSDLANATEKARSLVLAEMQACTHEYTKNRCAPKAERLPALNAVCDEWEVCMNQDPTSVMKVQVSARNVAEIINEFVGVMSLKAWGFILSALLVAVLANNIGFGRLRDSSFSDSAIKTANPFPSQPAAPLGLTSPHHDPNQAYIWAPIGQTPRRIKQELFAADATDTDNSPDVKAIMPPWTPSRRSPSKADREKGRSPSKSSGHNLRFK